MSLEESRENPLSEEADEEGGVPFRQGQEGAVRGEPAVGGEQVEVGVPLQEVSGGGHGDDEAGSDVVTGARPNHPGRSRS